MTNDHKGTHKQKHTRAQIQKDDTLTDNVMQTMSTSYKETNTGKQWQMFTENKAQGNKTVDKQ